MRKNYTSFANATLALLFLIPTILSASADDIIVGTPANYEAVLESKLLPFDYAKVSVDEFDASISDNATIFSDSVVYITEEGKIYEVYHRAYIALTESNLRYLAEDTYGFRPEREKLYVVLAETIKPDGTRIPITKEGIIHQTPQRDADLAIYSGLEELLLVFPGVEVGSIVHSIIVKEKQSHRIPGEYTDYWNWSGYWQTEYKRTVIDMPKSMAERLKAVTLGSPTPEIQKSNLSGNRVEWVMETKTYPIWSSEKKGAPLIQVGPLTFVTSIPDWDHFANWYGGLLSERSHLSNELLALSKDWVGDADSPEEILDRLYKKAAREVRYTSIDFGYAGLQPQPAETIWTNKYGDCKDKSNFLRLLLKAHGLEAYLTLINTDHAGRVDKRAPDYRYFNHAIVTVIMPEGTHVFCDPTIKYGWPGLMTASLANRPALIIDPDNQNARWVQTPAIEKDEITYDFNFELSPSGELSGWMEFTATNQYATYFQSRFDSSDEVSLRNDAERYARYFYPQAEMIDYEATRPEEFEKEFQYRAYLVTTLPRANGDHGITLGWPNISWLLPDVGDQRAVKREAYLNVDHINIQLQVALSDVHRVLALPRPFKIKAGDYSADGQWQLDNGKIIGHLKHKLENPTISPLNFPTLFQAVDSSAVWIDETIALNRTSEATPRENSSQAVGDLIEMKLMPTGKGQLALVDRLYAEGKNDKLRQRALEQVIQWFPKDITTRFEAEVRIGWIYWNAGKEQKAIDLAQRLIRDSSNDVSKVNINWAHYLIASSYKDLGQTEQALQIFKQLAHDSENTDFRRAWSYVYIASLIREEEAEEAFNNYVSAFDLGSGDKLTFLKQLTWHCMDKGLTQSYVDFLSDRLEKYPDFSDSMLKTISEQVNLWTQNTESSYLIQPLYAALKKMPEGAETILARPSFEPLNRFVAAQGTNLKIQNELKHFLEAADLDFWEADELENDALTVEAIEAGIQKALGASTPDEASKLALIRVLKFTPDSRFADWIWNATLYADWREKSEGILNDGLLEKLFEVGQWLPEATDEYINILFLKALYYKRRDLFTEEFSIYEELEKRNLSNDWKNSLTRRAGLNRQNANEYQEALEIYNTVFEYVEGNILMTDQLLSGAYILLENGETEKAIEWIQRTIPLIDNSEVTHFSAEIMKRWHTELEAGTLRPFWKVYKEWWPTWVALAESLEVEPTRNEGHEVPHIENWEALGTDLGYALNNKDVPGIAAVMRTALNAARWDKRGISEVQYVLRILPAHLETYTNEIHDLIIAIHEALPESTEDWKETSLVQYAQTLGDRGEYQKSVSAIEAFFELNPPKTLNYEALERIGALYSIKIDDDSSQWITRLEKQRNDPENASLVYTVNILAQLYDKTGEIGKETEVLETFFAKNPKHQSDVGTYLKSRLSALKDNQDKSANLSVLLNQWLTEEAPIWLRYMPTSDVPNYAADRIADILQQGSVPGNDYYDQIHFLFNCALDDRLTYKERENALISALGWMHNTIDVEGELADVLDSFCFNQAYSLEVRLSAIWNVYTYAIFIHDAEAVQKLVQHESFDQFSEIFKITSAGALRLATLDPSKAENLNQFIDYIVAEGQVHQLTEIMLSYAIERLVHIGAFDDAKRQLKVIAQSDLGKDPDMRWRERRLAVARSIKAAEKLEPLHDLLAQYFGEMIESIDVVAAKPKLRPANQFGLRRFYKPKELLSLLKYQWINQSYERSSLSFWLEFLRVESDKFDKSAKQMNKIREVLPLLANAVSDDSSAMEFIRFALFSIDLDDSEYREMFLNATEKVEQKADYKATENLIKAYRLALQIRTGERLDIEKMTKNVQHPWNSHFAVESVLEYYLSRNQKNELARYLEKLPSEVLFNLDIRHLMLIALDRAELDMELELLIEETEHTLQKTVAKALSSAQMSDLEGLFEMIRIIPDRDYINNTWVESMRSAMRHTRLLDFEMLLAHHNEDWPTVAKYADQLIDQLPKYYDYYYFQGLAQYKLGNLEKAKEAFSVFTKYSRNSYKIPKAEELLNSLAHQLNAYNI